MALPLSLYSGSNCKCVTQALW